MQKMEYRNYICILDNCSNRERLENCIPVYFLWSCHFGVHFQNYTHIFGFYTLISVKVQKYKFFDMHIERCIYTGNIKRCIGTQII